MKEPGLDGRHRDKDGEIRLKRADALNKNLPEAIPEFSPNATVGGMRKATGEVSLKDIRKEAKRFRRGK
jgi:hypothetical protein